MHAVNCASHHTFQRSWRLLGLPAGACISCITTRNLIESVVTRTPESAAVMHLMPPEVALQSVSWRRWARWHNEGEMIKHAVGNPTLTLCELLSMTISDMLCERKTMLRHCNICLPNMGAVTLQSACGSRLLQALLPTETLWISGPHASQAAV